jgi:hypothetical protein
MSTDTRRAVRKHKGLMVMLRDRLAEIGPGAQSEQIQFERIRPRTLVMIVVGSVAGYVLLSQLANVDLIGLLRTASWGWMVVALVLSVVTFVAAAWSLSGFVPEHLPLHRTILAQLAGSFATLVRRRRSAPSPSTCGSCRRRGCIRRWPAPAWRRPGHGLRRAHLLLFGFGIAASTQSTTPSTRRSGRSSGSWPWRSWRSP